MTRKFNQLIAVLSLCTIVFIGSMCTNPKEPTGKTEDTNDALTTVETPQSGAFKNHRDSVPSKEEYDAPLFVLSKDYPREPTPIDNPPWQQALNSEPISASNTMAYMNALKAYIEPNVLPFFEDNKNWNAADYDWYHGPWLGIEREAILGSYLGNGNPANIFSSLDVDQQGYALVLYDQAAAYTVGQIWGKTGDKLNLMNDAAQFEEGSVIVKFAFSNINYPKWSVMEGAQTFSIYDTIPTGENPATGYQVRTVSFFQMDIIVKDSETAPKTGWVYSTFVYDKDAPGNYWDKMVPLGAMWGNDPGVRSPIAPPYPPLSETVINPDAPAYSTETLGWGGRLSGPNDGAVVMNVYDATTDQKYDRLALSSCMSCHSPAEHVMESGLVPVSSKSNQDTTYVISPGSPEWMRWFRSDYGTVPFDEGQIAMDYDMVMAFKSMPNYEKSKPKHLQNKLFLAQIKEMKAIRERRPTKLFWH